MHIWSRETDCFPFRRYIVLKPYLGPPPSQERRNNYHPKSNTQYDPHNIKAPLDSLIVTSKESQQLNSFIGAPRGLRTTLIPPIPAFTIDRIYLLQDWSIYQAIKSIRADCPALFKKVELPRSALITGEPG
jgi:hypothetical protein